MRSTRRRARSQGKLHLLLVLLIGILMAVFLSTFPLSEYRHHETASVSEGASSTVTTETEVEEATILCSGDMIMHMPMVEAAGSDYDLSAFLPYVQPYIESADLSVGVLEAPLVESGFTGFPRFHAPDTIPQGLASAGYDVLICCHNHINDAGSAGIFHTMESVQEAGLMVGGIRSTEEAPRYVLAKAGKLDVAIVPYTYGGGDAAHRDTNGLPLEADVLPLVNTFSYDTLEQDIVEIRDTVKAAREAGADAVILYYHWGTEYEIEPDEGQKALAKLSVEQVDADIIVGSHPHVPQKLELVDRSQIQGAEYSGLDQIEIYYAMGNFLSNQRRELMEGKRVPESGYMVEIHLLYDMTNEQLLALETFAIPYWEDMSERTEEAYALIPLVEGYEDNEYLKASGHVDRATQALKDLERILAGEPVK